MYEKESKLFQQFYVVKISLYALDAEEAVKGLHIARIMELQQKMKSLNDLVVAVYKEHGYKFPVANFILNKADRQRKQHKKESNYFLYYDARFKSREEAIPNIEVFLKNLTSFIAQLERKLQIEEQRKASVGFTSEWFALRNRIDKCSAIAQEFDEHLRNARSFVPMTAELDATPLFDMLVQSHSNHNAPSTFGNGQCYGGAPIFPANELDVSKYSLLYNQPEVSINGVGESFFLRYVKMQFEVFSCELQRLLKFSDCEPQILVQALSVADIPTETEENVAIVVRSIRTIIQREEQFIRHVKKEIDSASFEDKEVGKTLHAEVEHAEAYLTALEVMRSQSTNPPEGHSPTEGSERDHLMTFEDLPTKPSQRFEAYFETKQASKKGSGRLSMSKILKSFSKTKSKQSIDSTSNEEGLSPSKEVKENFEEEEVLVNNTVSSEVTISSLPHEVHTIIEMIREQDAKLFGSLPFNITPTLSTINPTSWKRLFLVFTLIPRYHFLRFLQEVQLEIISLKLLDQERRTDENGPPLEPNVFKSPPQTPRRLLLISKKPPSDDAKPQVQFSEFTDLCLYFSETKRLERVLIVLKQMLALYELTTILGKLDHSIEESLMKWYSKLPALNQEILNHVMNAIDEKNALIHQQSKLIQSVYYQMEKLPMRHFPAHHHDVIDHEHSNEDRPAYLLSLFHASDEPTQSIGSPQDSNISADNKKICATKDIDRIARDALISDEIQPDLFFRYYILKSYIYAVDAFESAHICDWRRLSEIESNIIALNDLAIKAQIQRENLEAEEKYRDESKDALDGKPPKLRVVVSSSIHDNRQRLKNILMGEKSIFKASLSTFPMAIMSARMISTGFSSLPRVFNDYKRSTVLLNVETFISDLERTLKNVTAASLKFTNGEGNAHNVQSDPKDVEQSLLKKVALTQRIDQLQETISHLKEIAEHVKTTAPPTPQLLAEALALQQKKQQQSQAIALKNAEDENVINRMHNNSEVIKPHGLIIHVERKNAMIWGQAIIHSGADALLTNVPSALVGAVGANVLFQPYFLKHIINQTNSALGMTTEANAENDKQVVHWRPLLDLNYPYNNKRVLDIPEDLIKDANVHHKSSHQDIESGSSKNVPVVESPSGKHDTNPGTEEKESSAKDVHAIFAIFHYTFKHGDSVPIAAESCTHESPMRILASTPTHVAFFPLNKSYTGDVSKATVKDLDLSHGTTGIPWELSKTAKYTEIDFKVVFEKVHFAMNDTDEVRETYFLAFVSKLEKFEYEFVNGKNGKKRVSKIHHEYVVVENSPLLQLNVHESQGFQNEDDAMANNTASRAHNDDDADVGEKEDKMEAEGNNDDEQEHVELNMFDGTADYDEKR